MNQPRIPDPESIYLRLPIPLQHVACSYVGWRTERTRYGRDFDHLLAEAELRSSWTQEQTEDFRDRRLRETIEYCGQNVPYYQTLWQQHGVDPASVRGLADLERIPILSKADAQDAGSKLFSLVDATSPTRMAHTSGTTGGALRFPVSLRATQEQWAVWWRFRGWHGIRKGIWSGLFAGRSIVPAGQTKPPFWRINRPGRQILFSGYHMSEQNLGSYVGALRRYRPPWLHGYPSLLSLLASYVLENGLDLGYSLRWVTTGAENLMPHQIAIIEQAFGIKPLQHYGMAEGVANVSECEHGGLHVDEDYAAVEFIGDDDSPGCRVVGTGFANRAAVFVRYDTQDLAVLSRDRSCSCGRPGRLLERIDGRLEDYVVLVSGARVGRMDHIFKDMVNIREAQIRQRRQGEMTILVVRGDAYTDHDERALLGETRKRVGEDMRVSIEYVSRLTRSSTGKLRFVVSEMTPS